MEKIPSFCVDHIKLQPWLYVSRKDTIWTEVLTTFDIRITKPNDEPVMNTAEIHAIEHLGASFLRNHKKYANLTIYFWPMGCRTGFYLILKGDLTSEGTAPLMKEMFSFIADFEGAVPGQYPKDCGNHLDINLPMAKFFAKKYLNTLEHITTEQLIYPN